MDMWHTPKEKIITACIRKFGVKPVYCSVVSGLYAMVELPNGAFEAVYESDVR